MSEYNCLAESLAKPILQSQHELCFDCNTNLYVAIKQTKVLSDVIHVFTSIRKCIRRSSEITKNTVVNRNIFKLSFHGNIHQSNSESYSYPYHSKF